MMVNPVQMSDKALGGVRGQVEDGDPGGRRKLDSRGDPGGMRRPRSEERALESRGPFIKPEKTQIPSLLPSTRRPLFLAQASSVLH